jgi:hypothetical protein
MEILTLCSLSMKNTNEENTTTEEQPEFSQEEIDDTIAWVKASEASESMKRIIISCLKTVSTINAILMKNKISIKKLKSLFGFKTEKKSLKMGNVLERISPRKRRILREILQKTKGQPK